MKCDGETFRTLVEFCNLIFCPFKLETEEKMTEVYGSLLNNHVKESDVYLSINFLFYLHFHPISSLIILFKFSKHILHFIKFWT